MVQLRKCWIVEIFLKGWLIVFTNHMQGLETAKNNNKKLLVSYLSQNIPPPAVSSFVLKHIFNFIS